MTSSHSALIEVIGPTKYGKKDTLGPKALEWPLPEGLYNKRRGIITAPFHRNDYRKQNPEIWVLRIFGVPRSIFDLRFSWPTNAKRES